jgi:hypothetical protein
LKNYFSASLAEKTAETMITAKLIWFTGVTVHFTQIRGERTNELTPLFLFNQTWMSGILFRKNTNPE